MSVKKGPKFVLEKVQNLKSPPPWRFDKNIPAYGGARSARKAVTQLRRQRHLEVAMELKPAFPIRHMLQAINKLKATMTGYM